MSSRSLQEKAGWQWWMVFIGAPATILLGTFGYWTANGQQPSFKAWLNALYCSFQLLLVHLVSATKMPLSLELARWMALTIFGLAAVLTIIRLFPDAMRLFLLQVPWPRHVVIFGLGPKTQQLLQCFRKPHACQGAPVRRERVVIVTSSDDEETLEECRKKGATIVRGNMHKKATLKKARVHHASRIIALAAEDSDNMTIMSEVLKLIKGRKTCQQTSHPVKCHAHLSDVDTRAALQESHALEGTPGCEVHYFDLFDTSARKLLHDPRLRLLDRVPIRETDSTQVHLVILGFGRMGRTVALRAAQLGHFANGKPLMISVIDQQADRRIQSLLFRYPNFLKTCDFSCHELPMESQKARDLLEGWCADSSKTVSVAVCFDREALNMEVALRMRTLLARTNVPMFVRMTYTSGFASVLANASTNNPAPIHPFGMVEECCGDDLLENTLNETLAQAIHESYRKERIAALKSKGLPVESDFSTRGWRELSENLKDSNRQQADHIDIKLRALGLESTDLTDPRTPVEKLTTDEVELLAKMEHDRWNTERWLDGWTLGARDPENRVSPYLVDWKDLPDDIKEYDRQTVRKIPAFLAAIGKKVCKQAPAAPPAGK